MVARVSTLEFEAALQDYLHGIEEARAKKASHDQLRGLFMDFLHSAFGVQAQEVELEKGVKGGSFRGSIDALYKDIVFEFKRNLEADRAAGRRELTNYLRSLGDSQTYFALLTDGLTFEVYNLKSLEAGSPLDTVKLKALSSQEAFSWLDSFLFSAREIAPTSEDIVRRFGATSPVFLAALERLGGMADSTREDPSFRVKFDQWFRLLAYVYGSGVGTLELYLRHTYLSVLSRLIAFAALHHRQPRGEELPGVVDGQAFRRASYLNLVEEDFFSWLLLPALLPQAEELLIGMGCHLAVYDLGKINEDLLKQLYQGLVDPETRHDLGEFYTPDWLAELTLREAGFKPGMSLLDPACGSGTFLFTAIRLLREGGLKGGELVDYCRERVCGADIHPLAVTIARINYILALTPELQGYGKSLTIPIYMADSLPDIELKPARTIPIPALAGESFHIPKRRAGEPEALNQLLDQMAGYARNPAPEAKKGFYAYLDGVKLDQWEQGVWRDNFFLLRRLIGEGQDTIWPFILKNYWRPVYFEIKRFDLVAGNPPWLAYRYIQEASYQRKVKGLVLGYGLLTSKETKLFTHMELASLFFAFSADNYLSKGGTIALVMPRSVLTGAKQHARFQELLQNRLGMPPGLTLREVIDLEGVSPLFNVPACVLIADLSKVSPAEVTRLSLRGELKEKNLPWREARKGLKRKTEHLPVAKLFAPAPIPSPYLPQIKEGATIVPRPLWFVHPPALGQGIVDRERPYLESHPDAVEEAKGPWKDKVRLSGAVEARFLYATLLSKHLLPFGWTGMDLAVLPIEPGEKGYKLLPSGEALARGFSGLSAWLGQAERAWEKDRKAGSPKTVYDRLDYHHLLTTQHPGGHYLMFSRMGTHLAACVLDASVPLEAGGLKANGFVAYTDVYLYQTGSRKEADYVCAWLNAPYVNQAIKPFQSRGAWGERDIHRRPFEVVPIPRFNPQDARHRHLAELSWGCHQRVAELVPRLKGRVIGRLRSQVRGHLAPELGEIDQLVRSILVA